MLSSSMRRLRATCECAALLLQDVLAAVGHCTPTATPLPLPLPVIEVLAPADR